jgi:hypothetical protein
MLTIELGLQKIGEDIYFSYPDVSNMKKKLKAKIDISQLLQETDRLNQVLPDVLNRYNSASNQKNESARPARLKIENLNDEDNILSIIEKIKIECKEVFNYILSYRNIHKKYENILFVITYDSKLSDLLPKLQLHHVFVDIKNCGLTYVIKVNNSHESNLKLSPYQVIKKKNSNIRVQQIYGDTNNLELDNNIWSRYAKDPHTHILPPIDNKSYNDLINHTKNNSIQIIYYKSHFKLQQNPSIAESTKVSIDSFVTIFKGISDLKIAILLCCESFSLAKKLIEERAVDYVIATTNIISDRSIRNFINLFLHKCNVDDGRPSKPISSLVLEAQAEAFMPDEEYTVDVNSILFLQASGAPHLFWTISQTSNTPQVNFNLKSILLILFLPSMVLMILISQSHPNRQGKNQPLSSIPEKIEDKENNDFKKKCLLITNTTISSPENLITVDYLKPKQIVKLVRASTEKPFGYKFSAVEGQVIAYRINSRNVCNSLYSPNLIPLTISSDNSKLPQNSENIWQTANLPEDGDYILQFANIKGMGTLEIEMYLSPPPPSSPKVKNQQNTTKLQY